MRTKIEDLASARAHWTHRGTGRPAWAVTPMAGQESVWDYPRPPRLEDDPRIIRVLHGEVVVAETRSAIRVLETASPPAFYIPPEDVRVELRRSARSASHCEWKGRASYWSLHSGKTELYDVAWSYEQPYPEFRSIQGYLSFYPSKLECYVDGFRAQPQPGGFYGGWVTPEIVGPFKGDPGTGGW
ncbi:MAG: DUF427 domain-containing protein [Polyangiales bacterium]